MALKRLDPLKRVANPENTPMTKRDYERIASCVQEAKRAVASGDDGLTGVLRLQNELADLFACDSGAFKRERFERACCPGANIRARAA